MAVTATSLLQAWEAGAVEAPVDRGPSLLRSLGDVPAGRTLDDLTVGQCDARLFNLRRAMFGQGLDVLSTCRVCAAEVELSLNIAELQPALLDGRMRPVTIQTGGYEVVCRIPTNEDLRALAVAGEQATLRDLIERCLLNASATDGRPAAARELPEPVVEAIVEAIAEADPGAQTALLVRCPCGNEWLAELDIRAIVWSDLTDWVGRTLTEVHQLAQAYGWSETEILAMSAWRRRWYLEAAG
jgi:hypothetical protein